VAIPESQLETWSHQGSIAQSRDTYQTIRTALQDSRAAYADKSFNVFLQGSYGNDTNIYAESDVDTVIRLDSIMRSDLSVLPSEQQAAYHQAFAQATYTFSEFKAGVTTRLSNAFGAGNVTPGNKAIAIKASGARRSADVVVCYQYRRYIRFLSVNNQEYVPGVIFPSTSSGEIINYPKSHSDNCTTKHQSTNSWFKPMVRIVKNMRSRLVNDGVIAKDVAPSYYIEGLLYNVPNVNFVADQAQAVYNVLYWLATTVDRTNFVCANERYYLLRDNDPVCWPIANGPAFINAVVNLWDGWR